MSIFCNERNSAADTVCSRRSGHDGHHCDSTEKYAWTGDETVDCPSGYDHGQPPNRAARRGNKVHPRSAGNRVDYRPGTVRPGW